MWLGGGKEVGTDNWVTCKLHTSGRAVWGGRRVLIADGGGVGGALVATAVHARAEGGAGVAVCDGRVVRDGGRRHLLHYRRWFAPPAHAAYCNKERDALV